MVSRRLPHASPLLLLPVPCLQEPVLNHVAVKEAVLPFDKFAGADTLLGPEMRSTGEVSAHLPCCLSALLALF